MHTLALEFLAGLLAFTLGAVVAVGQLLYNTVSKQRQEQATYRVTVKDPEGHRATRDIVSLADFEKVTQDAVKEMAQAAK